MKTISVGLEWGSYSLQELDSKGFIVDDIGAEELGLDREFCEKIQKLQDLYDNLFLNNEKEFSYLGKEPRKLKYDFFIKKLDTLNPLDEFDPILWNLMLDKMVVNEYLSFEFIYSKRI